MRFLENHIPRHRTNDIIYFNPKDQERAFALNMLDCRRHEQRGLVVSNVIGIFKKLWADSWGPRMEDILRNGLYALIEQPRPVSILALPKLLTDKAYRGAACSATCGIRPCSIFSITRTIDGTTGFARKPSRRCSTSAARLPLIPSSAR